MYIHMHIHTGKKEVRACVGHDDVTLCMMMWTLQARKRFVPALGIKVPAVLLVNLGHRPFCFDIQHFLLAALW